MALIALIQQTFWIQSCKALSTLNSCLKTAGVEDLQHLAGVLRIMQDQSLVYLTIFTQSKAMAKRGFENCLYVAACVKLYNKYCSDRSHFLVILS